MSVCDGNVDFIIHDGDDADDDELSEHTYRSLSHHHHRMVRGPVCVFGWTKLKNQVNRSDQTMRTMHRGGLFFSHVSHTDIYCTSLTRKTQSPNSQVYLGDWQSESERKWPTCLIASSSWKCRFCLSQPGERTDNGHIERGLIRRWWMYRKH